MKKYLLLIGFMILMTAGLALWNSISNQKPKHDATLKTPPVTISEIQEEDVIRLEDTPLPLPTNPLPTPPTHRYTAKPDGNIIEFEVIDGLAIAYGDILLGKPEAGSQSISGTRGHYDAPNPQTWDRGEIPYIINPEIPNPKRIEKALEYFHRHTAIRFIPYTNQRDALVFEKGEKHCYSALGRTGGLQPIKLSPECQTQEIMHEVMHALGFVHEQSRPDRDTFVRVLWGNIEEKYHPQFAIVPESFFEAERNSPFDYHSIMMYQPKAFARSPDLLTMQSITSEQINPTQQGLSEGDIRRIGRLYNLYER